MKKGLIKSVAVLFAAFSLGGVVGWYYMLNVNSGMGYVKSSWTKDNGKWYYFDKWGYMYRDAWIPYKGDYYYVGADGAMWYNATTPDGYRVDGNGKWIR